MKATDLAVKHKRYEASFYIMKGGFVKNALDSFGRYSVAILCAGIVLMTIGVYLVGAHVPYGNVLLTVASAVVYVSIIILAVKE
jgi:hypothetical protein